VVAGQQPQEKHDTKINHGTVKGSRCLVATTIRSSSAPLVSLLHLNDTYRVDDAFKVHLTLTS
ncbi:unnamed protein product, partial [Prunus brigantina]